MQNAETVLSVIRARGQRGLRLERLYRQLFNPELYLLAYGKLYSNEGALTPGVTEETADGMSIRKIHGLIDALRQERFRWTPVRRTYIPKKDKASKRPLGIPTWKDKLLQEVMRLLLEAYYEPQFSDFSHGFRPGRGCHTALMHVKRAHRGTKWFIEGDISKCFDSFDHARMVSILRERINDERFIRLIEKLLEAGYMEDWQWHATHSGTPQGGVLSTLLSNIYLDRLDKFVETVLVPDYHQGEMRRRNPEYRHYQHLKRVAKQCNDREAYRSSDQMMRGVPSLDFHDPDYRRLHYVRYADDFLLSFAGPKSEAEEIKQRLALFLGDELKLDLSQAKTLITHGSSERARFLSYEIRVQRCDTWRDSRGSRNANGEIALKVPRDVLQRLCARYMRRGKPIQRSELILQNDYDIVVRYQAEYRGYVQYYALAQDLYRLSKLQWVMQTSLLKTLAHKHKSTVTKMARRYRATIDTEAGPRMVLKVVVNRERKKPLEAVFGGIPLRTKPTVTTITDRVVCLGFRRNELIQRLLAEQCEMCGSTMNLEVHHIRKMADLKQTGRREKPAWVERMAEMRRKTLVVCQACHVAIHKGSTRAEWTRKD